jgi:hypothetical protein
LRFAKLVGLTDKAILPVSVLDKSATTKPVKYTVPPTVSDALARSDVNTETARTNSRESIAHGTTALSAGSSEHPP